MAVRQVMRGAVNAEGSRDPVPFHFPCLPFE